MKKGGRERSQRAGAKEGADERVEQVSIHSPGRHCRAGRGGDVGTQRHHVQTQESCQLHSSPQQACFFPFHPFLPSQDKGFSGVGEEAEGANSMKDIPGTGSWQLGGGGENGSKH